MKLPSLRMVLFNAAAAVIGVAVLVGIIKPLLVTPATVPCGERYTKSTQLALQRSGALLSAADFQSRLGGRDAGVIDNLSIASLKSGPAPVAMAVSLRKGAVSPLSDAEPKGGMSFPWEPHSIQGKTAACVSYDVLLPADFDFSRGGRLPGLTGADADQPADDAFAARIVWRSGGAGGVSLRVASAGSSRVTPVGLEGFALPLGRWFRIEQEAILNTPKQTDGKLRVWLDGKLVAQGNDIVFRNRPAVTLTGVAADVFYGGDDGAGIVPKDAVVRLSPFTLRWE